jgi:excinuclease ABC subunit C
MSYAKKLKFERAHQIKKQIFALEHINDVALIDDEKDLIQDVVFRVEAYDVAHMKGSHSVGVMTVFENGIPQKSAYRKFILRNTPKGDDLKGLIETLTRRFTHEEWLLPDLVVIDGGKIQLKTAQSFFKSISLTVPIVSVVKDDSHKAREILGDKFFAEKYKKQIILINSEAHRFAIEFYRKTHRKSFLRQ